MGTAVLFPVLSGGSVTLKMYYYINLVPRLRMSGAVPLLPICVFMSCTGTNLLLPVVVRTCILILVETYCTICFQNVLSFCYWFRFSFQTYVLISFTMCCLNHFVAYRACSYRYTTRRKAAHLFAT